MNQANESDFFRRLQSFNRILELEDYFVWGCSPLDGPDGMVHVFYSRWPKDKGMEGWLSDSEIVHAVADQPEGPYNKCPHNPIVDYSPLGENK